MGNVTEVHLRTSHLPKDRCQKEVLMGGHPLTNRLSEAHCLEED